LQPIVMPGIGTLDDGRFIRAFQVIDRVIQRNQPLFVLVWVGSVLALIAAAALGIWALSGADRLLIILAALVYLLGVQLPTVTINVPLNTGFRDGTPTRWTSRHEGVRGKISSSAGIGGTPSEPGARASPPSC
jgi:uncharacterized membrane protein